ncbi:MAG: inositol monophosphatase family protein [Acidobacteriota bacterium]
MTISTPSWQELAEIAADLAWRAGRLTLADFQVGVEVERKADATPVTRADRGAEALLRRELRNRFPADGILGEEEGEDVGSGERTWILDPIDGTKSFIHGVPLYAVLVAVADAARRPAVGVIHLPALGETVVAWRGGGCWWNGRRAHVSTIDALGDGLLVTSDVPGESAHAAAESRLDRLLAAPRLRRTWGDAYGYALVATGRAEVMIDPVASPWDLAAVQPIIEEAGGVFTDLDGVAHPWGGSGLAAPPALHAAALALVDRSPSA